MPNLFKYNTVAESNSLKKGNFYIGTGDVGKGPTSNTGFYNGITPPVGGYTIYINKANGGPSIRVAANTNELIRITNQISGQSYTSREECLAYFASQTDKIVLSGDIPIINTNGISDFLLIYITSCKCLSICCSKHRNISRTTKSNNACIQIFVPNHIINLSLTNGAT